MAVLSVVFCWQSLTYRSKIISSELVFIDIPFERKISTFFYVVYYKCINIGHIKKKIIQNKIRYNDGEKGTGKVKENDKAEKEVRALADAAGGHCARGKYEKLKHFLYAFLIPMVVACF